MTNENILTKATIIVDATDRRDAYLALCSIFNRVKHIYSYFVRMDNDKYRVDYVISQNDIHNTLDKDTTVNNILDYITNGKYYNKNNKVVCYKQPSIEIMLNVYQPLMANLAERMTSRWQYNNLEYDDAYEICQCTMFNLYKKGYYIHKKLLMRSYNNTILMMYRHDRGKPVMVSMEDLLYRNNNDDDLSIADTIVDQDAIDREEEQRDEELAKIVFEETKEIIIDLIGQRQFEQLLRDYGNRHTTAWSRKTMQKIKNKFRELGITYRSFAHRR